MNNPFIEKLRKGITSGGDFPLRASTARSLEAGLAAESLSSQEQLKLSILADPPLLFRLMDFYEHETSEKLENLWDILEVSKAESLKNFLNSCAKLDTSDSPADELGSSQACLVFGFLLSSIYRFETKNSDKDSAFLSGSLATLPELLLSYYFPQVLDLACDRTRERDQSLNKSLAEILGISFPKLINELVSDLELTKELEKSLADLNKNEGPIQEALQLKDELEAVRRELFCCPKKHSTERNSLNLPITEIDRVLSHFRALCSEAGLESSFPAQRLIEILQEAETSKDTSQANQKTLANSSEETDNVQKDESKQGVEEIKPYVREVLDSVKNTEALSSRAGAALEALVFGFGFERALFLKLDKQRNLLEGKLALGDNVPFNPGQICRLINDPRLENSVYVRALASGDLETSGQSLFKKEEGSIALRISSGSSVDGIVYADRPKTPLSPKVFGLARLMAQNLSGQSSTATDKE